MSVAIKKVSLSPPPSKLDSGLSAGWLRWIETIYARVGNGPLLQQGYSRTGTPPADEWGSLVSPNTFSSTIFVYDATGGATLAFSNGSSWISCITGLAV